MQGKTLKIVFPAETFDFISKVSKKMMNTPITQPMGDGTFMPIPDPRTGKPVPMSKTGKVEEFTHFAIVQALFTVIMSNPTDSTFIEERMKIQKVIQDYGNFIEAFIGGDKKDVGTKRTSTSTTTTTTVTRK